jgi:hypothetical protein
MWLGVLTAGCASTGSTMARVQVWDVSPADPGAVAVAVPFEAGQNGTELVLAMMEKVKAAAATGVSGFEIQIGQCIREVSLRPQTEVVTDPALAELERITFRASETTYSCKRRLIQVVGPAPPKQQGESSKLGDSGIVEAAECAHVPVERIVTRYRFEVDHGFVPPDWTVVQQWTGLALGASVPRCDPALAAKHELRVRIHTGGVSGATVTPLAVGATDSHRTVVAINHLAGRAREAGEAGRMADAARFAGEALASWKDGAVIEQLDEKTAMELVTSVAAAHFYAVETEIDATLASIAVGPVDAEWATRIGNRIDRIAARYRRIADLVRLEPVEVYLRAGAARLAAVHLRAAEALAASGQAAAAAAERATAAALEQLSSAARGR